MAPFDGKIQDVTVKSAGEFIEPSQVDAFDYIRYGSLTGVVEDIATNATLHEQFGYVFAAKVELSINY